VPIHAFNRRIFVNKRSLLLVFVNIGYINHLQLHKFQLQLDVLLLG